ncbi:hypothetical protein KIN20_034506 [Parelaphostrongylus tenuis]|uniref:Uncharacterized protein n=1 Tax=Parelaphostrongylus tenuis TaxID=148309 RepID=A0AAD5WJ91_PARTN|nr:hypothetical protein KIN20_034506 [Parelaphostrongylus tenuis]
MGETIGNEFKFDKKGIEEIAKSKNDLDAATERSANDALEFKATPIPVDDSELFRPTYPTRIVAELQIECSGSEMGKCIAGTSTVRGAEVTALVEDEVTMQKTVDGEKHEQHNKEESLTGIMRKDLVNVSSGNAGQKISADAPKLTEISASYEPQKKEVQESALFLNESRKKYYCPSVR